MFRFKISLAVSSNVHPTTCHFLAVDDDKFLKIIAMIVRAQIFPVRLFWLLRLLYQCPKHMSMYWYALGAFDLPYV